MFKGVITIGIGENGIPAFSLQPALDKDGRPLCGVQDALQALLTVQSQLVGMIKFTEVREGVKDEKPEG